MNTRQAAAYLGLSRSYLDAMRLDNFNHAGPKFTKASKWGPVDYAKEDLDAWNQERLAKYAPKGCKHISGCPKTHWGRGFCYNHYRQWQRMQRWIEEFEAA